MVSRIVVSRIVLAAVIGMFGIAASVAPLSAKGGSGGSRASGGRAGFAFRAGLHAHGAFALHPHFHAHVIGHQPFRLGQRRNFIAPYRGALFVPFWGGLDDTGPYYPAYYPSADTAPDDDSAPTAADDSAAPRPRMPIAIYRPGCRTQAQTVPSEDGGTRTVHITRCY